MTLPTPPIRAFSFTDHSAMQPTVPQPGDMLDAEIDRGFQAIGALVSHVSVSLDPNGALKGQTVGFDQLKPDTFDAIRQAVEDTTIPLAVQRAADWAEKLDGPVDDGFYSARFWAVQADATFNQFNPLVQSLLALVGAGVPDALQAAADAAEARDVTLVARDDALVARNDAATIASSLGVVAFYDFGFIGDPVSSPAEDWGVLT